MHHCFAFYMCLGDSRWRDAFARPCPNAPQGSGSDFGVIPREKAAAYTGTLGMMAMNTTLVSRDPDIMSGALCFKGTRVPVQNLFDYLEGASSLEDFLEDFPSVSREMAVAVLEQARERLFADAPSA